MDFLMRPPGAQWLATPSGIDAKWTPTLVRFLPSKEMATLVYRWGTHAEMEKAWQKITAKARGELDGAVFFICHSCISSIALYRADKRRTKVQRRKYFERVALVSQKLGNLIDDSLELKGCNIAEFMSEKDYERLVHNLLHISFDDVDRKKAFANRVPIDLNEARFSTAMSLPGGVNGLLNAMSERALKEAEKPSLTSGKKGTQAEIAHFRDSLSALFTSKFGEPMDGVVKAFTQAAYPTMTILSDTIAKARQRHSQKATKSK